MKNLPFLTSSAVFSCIDIFTLSLSFEFCLLSFTHSVYKEHFSSIAAGTTDETLQFTQTQFMLNRA